jgi:Ca-activated chloride channel family protein
MWIQLGDIHAVTRLQSSIMKSPVVFGVKRSVAERLGWIGTDVFVDDILSAAESGQLHFMMSNAAQSDSGASAYLGFLYAFSGHPNLLTQADLERADVAEKIKRILGTVGRSAGSSGLLKDLFIQDYATFDGMVNYESVIIETNQELDSAGLEPLYVIYPVDGTTIADSPLAYIAKGDSAKEETFRRLQAFFRSDDVQQQLLQSGRRTGLGLNPPNANPAVFNPNWGIDTQRILTPIKIPGAEVVREALMLYQTVFRKPSFTVFALDFSGSMEGAGEGQVKEAMRLLLDQSQAEPYWLQAAPQDITIVVTFNSAVRDVWEVDGNDPGQLLSLANKIDLTEADGGTDIYEPVIHGLKMMEEHGISGYFPAVVLLTDGKSEKGIKFVQDFLATSALGPVPVFAITFGDASVEQLAELAELTSGKVYDGRNDLVDAFRQVRINN